MFENHTCRQYVTEAGLRHNEIRAGKLYRVRITGTGRRYGVHPAAGRACLHKGFLYKRNTTPLARVIQTMG